MAFGQRDDGSGPARFEYTPPGALDCKDAKKSQIRNDAAGSLLGRAAMAGTAIALMMLLAPFTVIPALESYAVTSADPVRIDPPAEGADAGAVADVHRGPSYVQRKLGFASAADGRCAKYWDRTESHGHRESMHCYATSKVSRLCDPQEREALVLLAAEYFEAERNVTYATAVLAATGSAGGQKPAQVRAPTKSTEEVMIAFRGLAEKGYIALDDFGWSMSPRLRAALEHVEAKGKPCG